MVYLLDDSRSHRVPEDHYRAGTAGVLMVDRYSGYKAMAQVKADILILAFCWAHVRRDFMRVGQGWPEFERLSVALVVGLNPRLWLPWYLQRCAEAGPKMAKDVEPFLPWNLPEERRASVRRTATG